MLLGNPAGLFALLALPLLVVIEFLRPKERRAPATTLFLLEGAGSTPQGGAKLRRFEGAPPFWLRVLAVLLLTWVLIDPRFVREQATRRVVVVLDSSASMAAFVSETEAALRTVAEQLTGTGKLEWLLLESQPDAAPLYEGASIGDAVASLRNWKPLHPLHAPTQALESARLTAGPTGLRVYITDHADAAIPPDVKLVAVGAPKPNAFIAHARAEPLADGRPGWRLLAGVSSGEGLTRLVRIRIAGTTTEVGRIELADGRLAALTGPWPEGADAITLELSPGDALALDDTAPLVRPVPRRIGVRAGEGVPEFFGRFTTGLEDVRTVRPFEDADLEIRMASAPALARRSIVVTGAVAEETAGTVQLIAAEPDPLTDGLSWIGFLGRPLRRTLAQGERVLLWSGVDPLVLLRERTGGMDLVLNFSWEDSNAERLPAMAVLLSRFVDQAREVAPQPWVGNLETGERLPTVGLGAAVGSPLLWSTNGATRRHEASALSSLRAPLEPGFVRLSADTPGGETFLLQAGVRFADVRESDLSRASGNDYSEQFSDVREARLRAMAGDPLRTLWVVLAGVALGAAWWLSERRGGVR
jgi:hypothetical protein